MDLKSFIDKMREIFEDANPDTIKPEAKFREIAGFSSLIAFLIIGMINEEYNIDFSGEDLRRSDTIEDIFLIVKSKQQWAFKSH